MHDWVHVDFVILTTPTDIMRLWCTVKLDACHSGRKSVCDRRSFPFLRSPTHQVTHQVRCGCT